jgi:hypothetical protein
MMETTDPKKHKALGRKVRNFDDKTWKKGEFCCPDLESLISRSPSHRVLPNCCGGQQIEVY